MTEESETRRHKPHLFLIVAVVAISFSAILVRLCHTPPLIIAFYRQLFSAILLFPFARNAEKDQLSRKDFLLLIFSGFFLALHFATWITGLSYTSVARATLFVDLQPIWAALLGVFFLSETLGFIEIFGIFLVTAGGALTMAQDWAYSGTTLKGDLLAVSGGIAGACYLLIGRKIRFQISWLRYMYSVYYISAAWLLFINLIFYRTIPYPDQNDLLWIALMAAIPSILGHGLFNFALRFFKAYVVNAAFLAEPIIATLLAFYFFSERPESYFYWGAVLVFAGILLVFSRERPSVSKSIQRGNAL